VFSLWASGFDIRHLHHQLDLDRGSRFPSFHNCLLVLSAKSELNRFRFSLNSVEFRLRWNSGFTSGYMTLVVLREYHPHHQNFGAARFFSCGRSFWDPAHPTMWPTLARNSGRKWPLLACFWAKFTIFLNLIHVLLILSSFSLYRIGPASSSGHSKPFAVIFWWPGTRRWPKFGYLLLLFTKVETGPGQLCPV
jgi:hypothetical protein